MKKWMLLLLAGPLCLCLTGFNRYKQLLSVRFGQWWKVNMITLLGMTPLAAGIICSIGVSSVLILLPCSILGGMIAGPFLAGLYDAILRGLRDDPLPWRDAWVRSWRQNWKASLIPGALMGLTAGLYAFMAMLLYLFSLLLLLVVCTIYWPQLVLFDQTAAVRLRNCILFCVTYFWRAAPIHDSQRIQNDGSPEATGSRKRASQVRAQKNDRRERSRNPPRRSFFQRFLDGNRWSIGLIFPASVC